MARDKARNKQQGKRQRWRVVYTTTPHVSGWANCHAVAEEEALTPNYRHPGRLRKHAKNAVFQLTIKGRGAFTDSTGSHSLPPGHGFLCRTADPAIDYYYPPDATEAWRFVFITIYNVEHLVDALTSQFGHVFALGMDHACTRRLLGMQRHRDRHLVIDPGRSQSLVMDVLNDLASHAADTDQDKAGDRLVTKAKRFIAAQLCEPLNANAVAAGLDVSSEHLSRLFSQANGQSLYQYIMQEKMALAAKLLVSSDDSIDSIARQLGLGKHFARSFKRHYGMTPRQYRHGLIR